VSALTKLVSVAAGQRHPGEQVDPVAGRRQGGDIIGLPVEACGEVGKGDVRACRALAARPNGQRRPGRKPFRHLGIDDGLVQPGAAKRLEPRLGLQNDRALGAGSNDRLVLPYLAGGARGPADVHAPAERAIEQSARREQEGVLVLFDHAGGEAGHDGAFRNDAACHAFEPDSGLAGRMVIRLVSLIRAYPFSH
jgi:hypothetical protein